MTDRILQVSNVFIAGHPVDLFFQHRTNGDPRERILNRLKPDIVFADKPQDLCPYIKKVKQGESIDQCATMIENETIMESVIFRSDSIPFVDACEKHGVQSIFLVDLPSTVRNVVPLYLDDRFGDQITRSRMMTLRLQEVRANAPAAQTILMFVDQLLMLNIYEMLLNWKHDNKPETYQAIKNGLFDSFELLLTNHLKETPISGAERYEKSGFAPEELFDQWTEDYLKIIDRAMEQNREGARVDNVVVAEGTLLSAELFRLSFQMYKVSAPKRDTLSDTSPDYMSRLAKERLKLKYMMQDGRLKSQFLAPSHQFRC